MGLILAIAKIRNVIFMRHVGFCYEQHSFRQLFDYFPVQLNNQMGFRQMNTGCSQAFPQKTNRINRAPLDI